MADKENGKDRLHRRSAHCRAVWWQDDATIGKVQWQH